MELFNDGYLHNYYKNASCFFIGGGPSLNTQDLSLLNQRGILTCAVNNIAARHVKPNLWVCSDSLRSFSRTIWSDPTIMKFIPADNYNQDYHKMFSCMNYYPRTTGFNPATYFTSQSVCWGNESHDIDNEGNKGGRTVMFAAIKILYYLGIRKIYLLGCDFYMPYSDRELIKNEGIKQPYAFEQFKWTGGCSSNNKCYEIMNSRFKVLRPYAEKEGLTIINCTPNSALYAFDRRDYVDVINELSIPPELPGKLANLYEGSYHG